MIAKETEKELLKIEIERLNEMLEDIVDKGNFEWNPKFCPVCIKAEIIAKKYNRPSFVYMPGRCSVCNSTEVGTRCGKITEARYEHGIFNNDGLSGEGIVFFRNLFNEYIIQIEEEIAELKK